ncbi:hypothetical protein CFC21_066155 [Triticum aestivum]|uniref:Agglutinin domain-containing protein n=3 Tax=Triticum TaxID=4564 RepID=A0A9R0TU14_TRITD|nr:uncharacterized protein LOC123107166 [Triticum aestivum]KAF7059223.1 hypothetical protein CFC21_066155 [Triticum aestivum]VAI18415.1 unnamed protein product [Triticum turgidum subsp. durum]
MGGCVAVARAVDPMETMSEAPPASGPRPPRCVAFQSSEPSGKYLCYARQGKGAAADGLFQLDGEDVTSPHTRFFMEPSKAHPGLLHVRCCYDNKYWAANQLHDGEDDGGWIVGAADEAEEDLSKTTCTLFKTTPGDRSSGYIRFVHAQLQMYACVSKENLHFSLEKGDEDLGGGYIVHDLSQQVVLPRYLAFKGDNGMYLCPQIIERHEYLQFSARGVDQALVNRVHSNQDGTCRIWSNHFGRFWRRSPNWIFCDSPDGATSGDGVDVDTLFRAVSFGSFVALQSLGNNWYCNRLTTEGKKSCLNAGAPTITAEARLRLEEAVASREIYDVVFDLSRPRVHGKTRVVGMAAASALNDAASGDTAQLRLECRDTEKRTWGSSVTVNLGVGAKIHAGVPRITAGGNVEVTDEFSGPYSWGSSMEKETTKDVAYQVTVPPKTRVTVSMVATRASCDVPFSYKQRDTLLDGHQVTHDMNDGLYSGQNCFDFEFVITSEENI